MMIYSYDKLWKLLIDRKITKTEMRQQTGISTNMLAKWESRCRFPWKPLQRFVTISDVGLMMLWKYFLLPKKVVTDNGWK